MISNKYEAAEIVVLGNAQSVICGCVKGIFFDDSPTQGLRTPIADESE